MAEAARGATALTTLMIGRLTAEVGLYGLKTDPSKVKDFDSAGPNGGVLKVEQRAIEVPADEMSDDSPTPIMDALTGEPTAADGDPAPDELERLHAPTAGEGRYTRVLVEEGSGEVVEPDAVRKGVRLDDGRFIDCTDQLAAITAVTKIDRMDVVATIDSTRVTRERVLGANYLGGVEGRDRQALRLLAEALRARREVAVVKYMTRSRQKLGVIAPRGDVLVVLELAFSENLREPHPNVQAVAQAQVTDEAVTKMGLLLDAFRTSPDVLDELRDDAIRLREELRIRAEQGEITDVLIPEPAEATPDLASALDDSLALARAGRV